MVVKVSKPEINVREKINELDKPSGIAGQAMLAAETPQEQFNLIGAGRKNFIINGGFDVWQRGTTVNTTMYSADRWMQWMTNAGVSNRNVNCTKQTGGPIGRNSSYIQYAQQTVDTGMEKFAWGQKIEKVNLDHIESGQPLTLSFWIKKEQDLPTDNNMAVQILYPNSTDGWSSGYLFRNDENIDQTLANISFNSLSTSWTRYSYTFSPSDTALDRGLAVYWHIGDTNFNLNNTNALVSFTGVQLEVGKVATPFEHRSYGEELAKCQRYYSRLSSDGTAYAEFGLIAAYDSTQGIAYIQYPTTMRTSPTATQVGNFIASGDQNIAVSSFTFQNATKNGIRDHITVASGFGAKQVFRLRNNNDGSAYIEFDAEL